MGRIHFRDELRSTLLFYALTPICLLLFLFFAVAGGLWYSYVVRSNADARDIMAGAVVSAESRCAAALTDAARNFDARGIKEDPEKLAAVSERLYRTSVSFPRPGRPSFFMLDKNLAVIAASAAPHGGLFSRELGVPQDFVLQMAAARGKPVFGFADGCLIVGAAAEKPKGIDGYLIYLMPAPYFESYMEQPNTDIVITDSFDYLLASDSRRYGDEQGRLAREFAPAGRFAFTGAGIFFITSSALFGGKITVSAITPVSPMLKELALWSAVILAALAASAAGIYYGSARIAEKKTRIMDDIVKAFENVMRGDLSTKLAVTSDDEFGVISGAYNVMLDSLKDLMRRNQEEARRTALSEIKQLESQFNPHFLFNTLENIRAMTAIDPQSARKMILELSALLRYSISEGTVRATLAQDLEITECYLRIQKYRFGDKFSYSVSCADGTADAIVPRLMLQPLIENSISHSFNKKESLAVRINARAEGECLVIEASDDGDGIENGKLAELREIIRNGVNETRHIGIFNIARRIQLMYGPGYGLWIDSSEGHGTTVILRLPLTAGTDACA